MRTALAGLLSILSFGSALSTETGDLNRLRARALELVNEARRGAGLDALQPGSMLNEAAQSHASDMLRRDYYAHESPEGETVADRYREAGGSRWALTAENIARCSGCPSPPTLDRVEQLHEGWMNSPPHRENILRRGLERFGFGIVAGGEGKPLFAVQTFAGPGTPRDQQPDATAAARSPDAQTEAALVALNREREAKGVPKLEASSALMEAAADALPQQNLDAFATDDSRDPFAAIPSASRGSWQSLSALVGLCGGCGVQPTAADVRAFIRQWLDDPQHRRTLLDARFTHLGLALKANGEGLKVALALLGDRR